MADEDDLTSLVYGLAAARARDDRAGIVALRYGGPGPLGADV